MPLRGLSDELHTEVPPGTSPHSPGAVSSCETPRLLGALPGCTSRAHLPTVPTPGGTEMVPRGEPNRGVGGVLAPVPAEWEAQLRPRLGTPVLASAEQTV